MSYWNPNARFENPREPQVRLPCLHGNMLVPVEFDALGDVTELSLDEIEKALELLAQFLTDKDHQSFLGIYHFEGNERMREAEREAKALRRVAPMLRAVFSGKTISMVRK